MELKHLLPISLGLFTGSLFAQSNPNIIVIYVDDMGYGDLSCYGGKLGITPNIDKLAKEGIRFTQYYSSAPVSSPSRVGLTTGMFPIRNGINTFLNTRKMNVDCEQKDFLDSSAPSMARELKKVGFATAHFGKWHMGGGRDVDNAPSINSFGFDTYSSTYESPDPDPLLTSTNWIWANSDSIKRWDRTAYFVDKTIEFLLENKNKNQPCFINLWPDDVHTPWVPNEEFMETGKKLWTTKKAFVPVLEKLDKEIGRLLNEIDKMGISENTLIILSSDNGPLPSFNNVRSGNLRGTKNSLYEGGIREPLIIRWPDKIKPNRIDSSTVCCAIDIFPSILGMLKIPLIDKQKIDGEDMSNALLGIKTMNRKTELFWDFGRNQYFNFPDAYNKSPHLAMRKGDIKVLCNSDGSDVQVFNLKKDKNETINLADKYPGIAASMSQKLIKWYNNHIYK